MPKRQPSPSPIATKRPVAPFSAAGSALTNGARPKARARGAAPRCPSAWFQDAQAMHRLHPCTFEVPSDEALEGLAAGDYVQVCVGFMPTVHNATPGIVYSGERFWAHILHVAPDGGILAQMDNHRDFSDSHGLRHGDPVIFERRHIYLVMPRSWWTLAERAQ